MRTLAIAAALSLIAACSKTSKDCRTGTNECSCKENAACDPGLVCRHDNTCGSAFAATVVVSDAAARGCEAVLTGQAGTSISTVTFNEGVVGTSVREAPRVAVSFVSSADVPLPAGGVKLGLSGPASGVAISKATCVDSKGAVLANAGLSVR